MIDRAVQVITSPFGWRKGFKLFHFGIDIRSWDDGFNKRLPAILIEPCFFIRKKYQKKWGWTYVFRTFDKETLKFTHIKSELPICEFRENLLYKAGTIVGYSTLTDYMRKKDYGEHLHFEYWPKKKPVNPIKYLKKHNKKWRFK